MNILVTGCNGQLGTELRNRSARMAQHHWVFADIVSPNGDNFILDITDEAAVRSLVAERHIDLIINCAAYTNVDRAEEDEAAAEMDDALMDKYFEEGDLSVEEIKVGLRKATLAMKVTPVLCGSSYKNKGVQNLLDAIVDYLPNPLDIGQIVGTNPDGAEEDTAWRLRS